MSEAGEAGVVGARLTKLRGKTEKPELAEDPAGQDVHEVAPVWSTEPDFQRNCRQGG